MTGICRWLRFDDGDGGESEREQPKSKVKVDSCLGRAPAAVPALGPGRVASARNSSSNTDSSACYRLYRWLFSGVVEGGTGGGTREVPCCGGADLGSRGLAPIADWSHSYHLPTTRPHLAQQWMSLAGISIAGCPGPPDLSKPQTNSRIEQLFILGPCSFWLRLLT